MPLFSESEEKIYGDILLDILDGTNITRTSPGSKVRAISEALSRKLGKMWRTFDLNVGQAFIDGANGQYLDYIGDMMGIARLGEEPAAISALDRNVKFYVDAGTFGTINGGSSVLIPSGTIISTGSDGEGIRYRTIINTILDATTSEGYISVESVASGSGVNVGRGQLIYHDFNDYSDSANNTLKVTNVAEVIQGQDLELDANYRFRITNQIVNLERANATAIRLAALTVPGVADVTVIPYHRGIGTYDILIEAVTPTVSETLIAAVQLAVDQVTAMGIVGTVRGPIELGLSVVGTLTLRRTIAAQEQTNLIESVTNNVTDYINELDIAEDFIVNEMVERVMATSDLIKNIGTATKPFDQVFLYTPSKLEDNKIRSTLLGDYSPEVDEKILVENVYAGTTPILFRVA